MAIRGEETLPPKESDASWGAYAPAIEEAIARLDADGVVSRIWSKDPTVWKANPAEQNEIVDRLGWLDAPLKAEKFIPEVQAFAAQIRAAGTKHVVLMGMGGSSLAPEVFRNVIGPASGYPRLLVLDSTDPESVKDVRDSIDFKKTLFVFASKSGTTTEPFSFYKFFRAEAEKTLKDKAGSCFAAITDPGTSLEKLAAQSGFLKTFTADPEVGGRFSALTHFGLVPAALLGVDLKKLVSRAKETAEACRLPGASRNPAVRLGAAMAVLSQSGRDKLTIAASKKLEAFGDWAEQLVAESTGKEGKGVVPVVREPLGAAREYGSDRFFVSMSLGESASSLSKRVDALAAAGHPALRLRLRDVDELGSEFFRWEMATAIAGSILGINPFDQPDVQSAKDKTKALLKEIETNGKISFDTFALKEKGFSISCGTTLGARGEWGWSAFWSSIRPDDGIHVLSFLPNRENILERLARMREAIRAATKNAVTASLGPRYLHSSGQLHKGGAANGLYLILAARRKGKLPVPGDKFSFEELERAQAIGDFQALNAKNRRVILVELPDFSVPALESFEKHVFAALTESAQAQRSSAELKNDQKS